jgi:hypothetical protein
MTNWSKLLIVILLIAVLDFSVESHPRHQYKGLSHSFFSKQVSQNDSQIHKKAIIPTVSGYNDLRRYSKLALPIQKNPLSLLNYPPVIRFWYHDPP